jgi:hypothetical protein
VAIVGAVAYGVRCPHVPALWEVFRGSLGDEVADDFGSRLVEVRGQIFELLTCRVIEPQHEAVGIRTRIVGTLAWCHLLLTGGKILDGDLAHPGALGRARPEGRREKWLCISYT